jgi:hypothetical protein
LGDALSFLNTLPGVPNVESPFFARSFADSDPETRRVAQDLRRDGLAVIDFPEPEFAGLADTIIAELSPRMPLDAFRAGLEGGPRIEGAWRDSAAVRRLAVNAGVIDLLSRLFGRPAFPFQTLNFPVGTQQHAHTDSVHFSSMPERFMCGVWIALEDIHPDAGPLLYYPGSHRLPVFTNEHIGFAAHKAFETPTQAVYESMWDDLVEAEDLKPALFAPKRGQAVIWLANLLHGGSPQNDRNRTRWSQVTHYYFEDCAYYTPMHSNPPMGRIAFREITDIRTGAIVPNRHLGEAVPRTYIEATALNGSPQGASPLSLARRAARRFQRLIRR